MDYTELKVRLDYCEGKLAAMQDEISSRRLSKEQRAVKTFVLEGYRDHARLLRERMERGWFIDRLNG